MEGLCECVEFLGEDAFIESGNYHHFDHRKNKRTTVDEEEIDLVG